MNVCRINSVYLMDYIRDSRPLKIYFRDNFQQNISGFLKNVLKSFLGFSEVLSRYCQKYVVGILLPYSNKNSGPGGNLISSDLLLVLCLVMRKIKLVGSLTFLQYYLWSVNEQRLSVFFFITRLMFFLCSFCVSCRYFLILHQNESFKENQNGFSGTFFKLCAF